LRPCPQALRRSQDELRSSMAAVADMARSMKDSLAGGDAAPLSAADLRRELLSLSSSLAALGLTWSAVPAVLLMCIA
jgi:hypothetical protein